MISITNKNDLQSLLEALFSKQISETVECKVFDEVYESKVIIAMARDIVDIDGLWLELEEKQFTVFYAVDRKDFLKKYIKKWAEDVEQGSIFWDLLPYYDWGAVWCYLTTVGGNQFSEHYDLGIVIDYTKE